MPIVPAGVRWEFAKPVHLTSGAGPVVLGVGPMRKKDRVRTRDVFD
jgi:hypothetical protein